MILTVSGSGSGMTILKSDVPFSDVKGNEVIATWGEVGINSVEAGDVLKVKVEEAVEIVEAQPEIQESDVVASTEEEKVIVAETIGPVDVVEEDKPVEVIVPEAVDAVDSVEEKPVEVTSTTEIQ